MQRHFLFVVYVEMMLLRCFRVSKIVSFFKFVGFFLPLPGRCYFFKVSVTALILSSFFHGGLRHFEND